MNSDAKNRGAMRLVPYMGVIWVVAEAEKLGFYNGHPEWCNLGQGQPEVGPIEGAPPRYDTFVIKPEDHAYGPVHGTVDLRRAVAAYYNRVYRSGKASQYTEANVAIASGGRLALTRAIFALGSVNLGYMVPDYSAYEDELGGQMHRFNPIPLTTDESSAFKLSAEEFRAQVDALGLEAMLLSNPCNPTARVIRGAELDAWVEVGRSRRCTLLMDEFYSHFIYDGDRPAARGVSAAEFVRDVNEDPVMIFDGLTKNFRYPGWRLGWVVAPQAMIETLITAGSSIDGGPSRPIQRAAIEVLAADRADRETRAVREVFTRKRNVLIERLTRLGVRFPLESQGTFYAFGCIDRLPAPLNDADVFFRAALERKVMTVPGRFFDVNPGGRRHRSSPLAQWVRFSFGPPMETVTRGLDRLEEMIRSAR